MELPAGDEFPVLSIAGDELRFDRGSSFSNHYNPFPCDIFPDFLLEENVDKSYRCSPVSGGLSALDSVNSGQRIFGKKILSVLTVCSLMIIYTSYTLC